MDKRPEKAWIQVPCDPRVEYVEALRGLKVPEFPFRWNPRDGIFAPARDLPPSIDVADLLEALIEVEPLKDVEYPINTLHWKIMTLIGACYERVVTEYYLLARMHMKDLVELMKQLKRSGEPDGRKYHIAFSYIAYALLTIDEEELVNQPPANKDDKTTVPPAEVGESSRAASQAEAAQKVDEPVPSCSSTLDVKKRKPRRPPPRRQDLPTDPDERRIPKEILMLIYQYAALFFKRYGLRGIERADQYLSRVIRESESRKSWWYFERAKLMERKRESVPDQNSPVPTELEFRLMEAAINIRRHAFYELHYGKLLGQMGDWEYLEAALDVYTEFEEHFSNPDLLCKCVEGILDLIRDKDSGPQRDKMKDFTGKKNMYNNMLEAALHVLYIASNHPNHNIDLIRRCLGHYYLLHNARDSRRNAVKILRQCYTYTYDTALELTRLEEGDQENELKLYKVLQKHAILNSFFSREIIAHDICSLNDLKDATETAAKTLVDDFDRMADVKTVYIPRLIYLKTRHGINWADVLEWHIERRRLQNEVPYDKFLAVLREQRQSIYGETGREVDFDNPYEYYSLEPTTDKRDNDLPDVTGSTYFSRNVGEIPVNFLPDEAHEARESPENFLSTEITPYDRLTEIMSNFFHPDRVRMLERITATVNTENPQSHGSRIREGDIVPQEGTQSEELSERRERPRAIGLLPPPKYEIGSDMITRWRERSAFHDDNSILSYKSSDEEAFSGRTSRESRRTPSPLPGTARRSSITPSVASSKPRSLSGSERHSREDLSERLKMNIPRVKISEPDASDTDRSSSDPSSQQKRARAMQGRRRQSADSDTSSAFSISKVMSIEETSDEEEPDVGGENLPPLNKAEVVQELRTVITTEMERLLHQKQMSHTESQSELATPAQEGIAASPLFEQVGRSDLLPAPEGSTRHPVAGTAKALGELSIGSKPLHTTSVEERNIQTSSGEVTGDERQTPATDTKSSPEEVEVESDGDGTSTGKKDDPDNTT